jgi:hypothetical protein
MFRATLWQRGRWFDPAHDPRCAKEAPTFEALRFRHASDDPTEIPDKVFDSSVEYRRRPTRTRRKSMDRPPNRPGGGIALMREVGTTPARPRPESRICLEAWIKE